MWVYTESEELVHLESGCVICLDTITITDDEEYGATHDEQVIVLARNGEEQAILCSYSPERMERLACAVEALIIDTGNYFRKKGHDRLL